MAESPQGPDSSSASTLSSAGDWITKAYVILNGSLGIDKFNQAIPLIISAIAIGVSLVNRNAQKCVGHVVGATIVALVSALIISKMNIPSCNQFTTAFLWYTISYVSACMQNSNKVDAITLIGIIIGYIILVFVDFVTFMGGGCGENAGSRTYVGMMLLGGIGGIGGFYAWRTMGEEWLYDFDGCSCEACYAKEKCSAGSKVQTIIAAPVIA